MEVQGRQRSYLQEREEQLEHSGTTRDGEKKPKATCTTEGGTEIHQRRIRSESESEIVAAQDQAL